MTISSAPENSAQATGWDASSSDLGCQLQYCNLRRFRANCMPTPNSKTPPPESTYEEVKFLKALREKQRLVNVKLMGGDVVCGWIEYYDKNMIRLTRDNAPNLFIFKTRIMYIAETARPSTGSP